MAFRGGALNAPGPSDREPPRGGDPFHVRVGDFEGPLDLLLHLVRKHEVEVEELPLGRITSEYLETLSFLEGIDLEPAGEFLEVAATLVRMKVRTLLPRSEPEEEDEEAEGVALLEQLVEHQVARMAADRLEAHEARAASIWFRGRPPVERRDEADEVEIVEADLFSLVTAFRDLMKDLEAPAAFEIRRDEYPVAERAEAIRRRLAEEGGLGFEKLFDPADPRAKLIATFLALLELIRGGEARAFQEGVGGPIAIFPGDDGAETTAADDEGEAETDGRRDDLEDRRATDDDVNGDESA